MDSGLQARSPVVNKKLAAMFVYSFMDVLLMESDNCMIKMQPWLLGSFVIVVMLWCIQKYGQCYSHAGKQFLFCLRQKSKLMQSLIFFQWGLLLPCFTIWTVLGTTWFRAELAKRPNCLYEEAHPWLVIFWQSLSYLIVVTYTGYLCIACLLEYRLRSAERNMRQVETDESVSRWGHIGPAPDLYDSGTFSSMAAIRPNMGLNPSDIQNLPKLLPEQVVALAEKKGHCPICLSDFCAGDQVRELPSCGHCYHQACIDLWLVRRSDCPMCKGKVQQSR